MAVNSPTKVILEGIRFKRHTWKVPPAKRAGHITTVMAGMPWKDFPKTRSQKL